MLYDITTLTIRLGGMPKAVAGVDAWVKDGAARGQLFGCWTSEIGDLNKLIVLRGFEDMAALTAERTRAQASTDPFGAGEVASAVEYESYTPFPFCGPIVPGTYGAIYEIRTYRLKHGGVPPTIAAWEVAMIERAKVSPLVVAMAAIDGPPRFTHIWPFASLNARSEKRAEAVAKGIWPPKGGPDWLTGDMRSTIALPTAISPLA